MLYPFLCRIMIWKPNEQVPERCQTKPAAIGKQKKVTALDIFELYEVIRKKPTESNDGDNISTSTTFKEAWNPFTALADTGKSVTRAISKKISKKVVEPIQTKYRDNKDKKKTKNDRKSDSCCGGKCTSK